MTGLPMSLSLRITWGICKRNADSLSTAFEDFDLIDLWWSPGICILGGSDTGGLLATLNERTDLEKRLGELPKVTESGH